jgi:hypothetical protein
VTSSPRLRRLAIIVMAVSALGLAAGIAWATIPDGGVIHGCYKSGNGQLRVVSASDECLASEKSLDWNQVGPAGEKGDKGDTGAPGPPGVAGLQTVALASLSNSISPKEAAVLCPAGKRVIAGGASILGGDVSSGPSDLATAVALKSSRPLTLPNGEAWTARAEEIAPGFDGNWSLTIYAICATVSA